MILTPHILVGAAIGAKTQNLGLIIILGIAIHFIMDIIPHWDYDLPSVFREFRKNKNLKALLSDFVKMTIDITIGLLVVFTIIYYKNFLDFTHLQFILVGIIFSILPDIFFGFSYLISKKTARKINKINEFLHCKNKQKKGKITFLGIATQLAIIIISCALLLGL